MPNASQFRSGFGFRKNRTYYNYKLTEAYVGHDEIERYRKYEYPTELTFTRIGEGDPEVFVHTFVDEYMVDEKVIYSGYGNPYICTYDDSEILFDVLDGGNTVIIKSTATGVRSFDISKK